jgi:hypothetical protein
MFVVVVVVVVVVVAAAAAVVVVAAAAVRLKERQRFLELFPPEGSNFVNPPGYVCRECHRRLSRSWQLLLCRYWWLQSKNPRYRWLMEEGEVAEVEEGATSSAVPYSCYDAHTLRHLHCCIDE